MKNIKKGDIVARISYGKDIIFSIEKIVRTEKHEIAILKGITKRIVADSYIEDLVVVDKRIVQEAQEKIDNKIKHKLQTANLSKNFFGLKRGSKELITGSILHLDGDKRYSQKSMRYYKSLGLNANVKNIAEYKQPKMILELLEIYNPDILIVTGHDGMIRKGIKYNDIYNYRNSRYFIQTVKKARQYKNTKELAIFAGACQSFYEALIEAGANFASSPGRIMIDFIDPLIVAERIATTDNYKYLRIEDIKDELRDGEEGVSGIGSIGKKKSNIQM